MNAFGIIVSGSIRFCYVEYLLEMSLHVWVLDVNLQAIVRTLVTKLIG